MSNQIDKYNSIPFIEYYLKKNGVDIFIDYEKRFLTIFKSDKTTSFVYFSNNINHDINKNVLLNRTENDNKAYFVYENGIKGQDWLWHIGDLVSIDDLLSN